jgi:hypothetical protein
MTPQEWAERLHELTVNVHGVRIAWSRSRWEDDFRKLAKSCNNERVEKVLAWYEHHAKTHKKPIVILSATMFRARFFDLLEPRSTQAVYQVKPETELGKKITADLRTHFLWPNGSDQQLPAAVEASIANHNEFKKKVNSIRNDVMHVCAAFLDYSQWELGINETRVFINNWFVAVHNRVGNWKAWNGDLMPFVFSIESPQLANELARLSHQYTRSAYYVGPTLKALKE